MRTKQLLFILPLLLVFLAPMSVSADLGKDPDPIKMAKARAKYNDGDYHGRTKP